MAKAKTAKRVVRRPAKVEVPEHLRIEDDEEETPVPEPEVDEPDVNDNEDQVDGDENDEGAAPVQTEQSQTSERTPEVYYQGAPKNGIVLGPNDPIRVRGVRVGNEVVLTVPVYRAVKPANTSRWSFVVVYHVGSRVHVKDVASVEEA